MLRGYFKRTPWQAVDQNMSFYFVSAVDLQIIIGILLWFAQQRWDMLDSLRSLRHPALMLAAWAAIRVGWYRVNVAPSAEGRFTRGALFFTIAGIVMMTGVFQVLGVF